MADGLGSSVVRTGVQVVLDADPVGIIKGFAQADTAGKKFAATLGGIQNVGKATFGALQNVAQGFERTARRVRNAGIGLGISLVAATAGAMSLDAAMHNVATIDENVRNNFNKSIDTAIEMSRVLPASAKDITEAWYEIASSGFYGAEGTMVLNQAVKAGVAGLSNTAEAGGALTAVLNAYGLSAANAGRISDLMFQTVNLGVLRFGDLTSVVGDTVGMAATAGIGFKEVGAALATMTLNGISASEAGTSLNRLIQSLVQPTESLSMAWSRLSNQTLTQALRTQGLKAVMDQLRIASGGNIEVLKSWFDEVRAARGAFALMGNDGATYTRVMNGMGDATKGAGATQKAFEEQMKSTSMQLKLLLNQIKSIGLEIGTALLPLANAGIRTARIFADAWNMIPAPIVKVVSWLTAFADILMIVGGLIGVFVAKSLIGMAATRLLGAGVQRAGTFVMGLGTQWEQAGTRIQNAGTRIAATRSLLSFDTLTRTVNLLGTGVATLGTRFAAAHPHMSVMGTAAVRLGAGLQTLASVIPRVAAALPMLGLAAIIAFSAFSQANQAADVWIQGITQNIDTDNVRKLDAGIERLSRRADQASASWNSWGVQAKTLGFSFKDLVGNINLVKTAGVQTAHNLANFVGFGSLISNPAEERAKATRAINEYNRFVEMRSNIFRAGGLVMNEVARTDDQFWDQMLNPKRGTAAQQQVGFMNLVTKAAKNLGIDIKNTKNISKQELKELTDEVQRMGSKVGMSAAQIAGFADDAVKQYKKMKEEIAKFVQAADESLMKGFDVAGAVTEKGKAGQKQLTDFFFFTVGEAGRFVADIETLMRRGLDPEIISQLIVAGPEASALAIRALLDDVSGDMIRFANEAMTNMRNLRIQLAREAEFVKKAAMNPAIAADIGRALDIANIAQFMGVRNTPEKIAMIMGLDAQTVETIARNFEIPLGARMETSAQTMLDNFSALFGPGLKTKVMEAADAAGISDQQAGKVFETLVTKGKEAATDVVTAMDLIPEKEQILLDLINWLAVMSQLGQTGAKADEVGAKRPHIPVTADTSDADRKLNDIGAKAAALAARRIVIGVQAAASSVAGFGEAKGGVLLGNVQTFARGGEHHVAQIAKGGTWRLWAEPETGGEAYIPLHHGRPTVRDLAILDRVAKMFGYNVVPAAEGKFYDVRPQGVTGGSGRVVNVSSTIVFTGPVAGHDEFKRIARDVVDRRDREVSIALSRKG